MKTADFIREHNACHGGAKWALSISKNMSDVWDMMVKERKHDWLIWTATRPGVFPDSTLRKLACRFVRETPVSNGRTVWELLTDERSRKAIEVTEAYVDGNATEAELAAAYSAACDAYSAADADGAAHAAACYAGACAAAYAAASYADADADADYYAACAAARAALAAARAALAAARDAYAAAYTAACVAADAAHAAASDAADSAACAAYADACAAANAAQARMIAELGNPFKRSLDHENS
jgi:hypothetical protein